MINISDANLGSIAANVLARFPDCTAGVSGQMLQIVDEQRIYVEDRTGLTIGSVAINQRFQPAITSLALANAMELSKLDGANAGLLSLGDFQIRHNADDPIATAAQQMRLVAEEQLKRLGKTIRFKRIIGGS